MLKKRKTFKVTTEKTAQVPFVRVLIAIAVIYALIKTLQIHPALGLIYAVLGVVVFFHFRRRRQLEDAGVEMPSPYAADRAKAKAEAEAAEATARDESIGEEKNAPVKSLPKRLDKSDCRH